jgi:hypothetical protein
LDHNAIYRHAFGTECLAQKFAGVIRAHTSKSHNIDSEGDKIQNYVAGTAWTVFFPLHMQDSYRRFRRNAPGFAYRVGIEHEVADH